MNDLSYFLMKIRSKLSSHPKKVVVDYFRRKGMRIGADCTICSNILTTEPYLIHLGDNVTIAGEVLFVTHDNSISKVMDGVTDLFGEIIIGDSCFIGNRAVLLYGITLADHIIVAAGSVVTKSFLTPGVIIGGNPAQIIGSCKVFQEKNCQKAFDLDHIPKKELSETILNSNKLVQR